MAGLKKMQRAHKAPPKIKLRNLENFTKNEDFYKKPRNNFFFQGKPFAKRKVLREEIKVKAKFA